MRPINLIPAEQRRGEQATRSGSGALSYVIVALLAVAVVAVAFTTHYGSRIDESKAEISALESDVAATNARAQSLTQFTEFQSLRDARVATIDSLARTRFNWERVLREMARIIPEDVALTNVTGTVNPAVSVTDEAQVSIRDSVPGPALEITGCSRGQRNVARFVAALHDIDGVTRVTAAEGVRGEIETDQEGSEASGECKSSGDSLFQVVAAFDPVPTPEGAIPPAVDGATVTGATGATVDPEASAQQAQSQAEVDQAAAQSAEATNLNPAG